MCQQKYDPFLYLCLILAKNCFKVKNPAKNWFIKSGNILRKILQPKWPIKQNFYRKVCKKNLPN